MRHSPLRPLLRLFVAVTILFSSLAISAWGFTPNAQELDIAQRMKTASGQQRDFLEFDPILSEVARARAADMAKRNYFAHINPDGHGANYLVRQAGYVLPSNYPGDGNNIESIAAGGSTAAVTWSDWMGSSDHKMHLLGEIDFFAQQTSYGVGYYADPNSAYGYYWVVITAPPNPRPAGITIVSPSEGALVSEGTVAATGASSGSQAASVVQVAVENVSGVSAWRNAAGTQAWVATLQNVVPGPNTLRVRSLDAAGTVLATASRGFQYVVLRPLTVNVVGQGSVGSFAGTTSRRVGLTYTIVATPATGWLFTGWSGSWSGADATTNVLMREGLAATATFVPNPFIARRGMFAGLIGEASPSHDARGSIRVQMNAFGAFTAQLLYAGNGYSLSGQFRLNGRATLFVARTGASPLTLVLDLNGAGGSLTGTILENNVANNFTIAPSRQPGAALAALAGRYTVAFNADRANATAAIPQGDGYGILTVDTTGTATLSAALADGTTFLRGGWIAADGTFAFYTPLYAGAGELSGRLLFSNQAGSDLTGTLAWKKPRLPSSERFRESFSTSVSTVGSRYSPPASGRLVLAVSTANPNLRVLLGAGDLSAEIPQPARLGGNNLVSITNPFLPGIAVAIDPVSGTYIGSFMHPVTHTATRFRGVFLQKENTGAGYFLGPQQSGYASVTALP